MKHSLRRFRCSRFGKFRLLILLYWQLSVDHHCVLEYDIPCNYNNKMSERQGFVAIRDY